MPWFDLPPAELALHRVTATEPPGLDGWWSAHIEAARAVASPTRLERYRPDVYGPLPVWDVEFAGDGGDRIRAWYLRPPGTRDDEPLPLVTTFIGYGGGRGAPVDHLSLPALGFASLVMDTRGQGGSWTTGATGDPGGGVGPEHPGVMTRGIADPDTYYYKRLFIDAVRALDVGRELSGVDATRVAVSGVSQGGGLALAAAALQPNRVQVCHADVPFLCDIARAVTITASMPYAEVANFLAQHVELVPAALRTLSYVDCALLARRITADCLLSVGLMDEVCPPSTVYAAYHEIRGPKQIAAYDFGVHQVPNAHAERQITHLRERLGGEP